MPAQGRAGLRQRPAAGIDAATADVMFFDCFDTTRAE
jgi:hypothetical protein